VKVSKNYYRDQLLLLLEENRLQPIVFKGRYKHTDNPRWATFDWIRRYENGKKTKTICNHINLEREAVHRYVYLTKYEHNRSFYFWGRVSPYVHYSVTRGGIVLAQDIGKTPIWMAT